MTEKDLTKEQVSLLRERFSDTRNAELAALLGVSVRTVVRWARLLGLRKSPEFVAAMQRNASAHSVRANRASGGNAGKVNLLKYGAPYRFKAGESNKDRMDAESYAAMHRRIGARRKELYRAERRRVLFGLEQQTRLRVVRVPKEKVSLRLNLRKRGYEVGRGSNEAVVTPSTRRSSRLEAHAAALGIKVKARSSE